MKYDVLLSALFPSLIARAPDAWGCRSQINQEESRVTSGKGTVTCSRVNKVYPATFFA